MREGREFSPISGNAFPEFGKGLLEGNEFRKGFRKRASEPFRSGLPASPTRMVGRRGIELLLCLHYRARLPGNTAGSGGLEPKS